MSNAKWSGIALMGVGSALLACSGSGGGGMLASDAGMMGDVGFTSDAGAGGDAGGTDDSASNDSSTVSCSSPDAGGLPYTGIIELSRIMMPPAAARFGSIGQFETATSAPATPCTGTLVGACCYETTGTTAPTPVSAGTITVTDGTNTLATLMPPTYVVSSATASSFTWTPGSTLKVASSGATIDVFSASLVAPALLAGLSPSFAAAIDVSLKADFVVTWTPAKEACSQISFGFSQGAGMPHIGCVADDSAGTLTVPMALLSKLTAASGTAVMERVEGKRLVTTNAGIGFVVLNVLQTTTTYTP